MSNKIRIGAVAYLNTRPLVLGMEQGLGADRIELSYAVPSRLADQMTDGELDIALLPVIELARIPDLELLPGLGIATKGPCRSVLLVSRVPVDRVRRVVLDPESRTSNALIRVLFGEVWRRTPEFVPTSGTDLEEQLAMADAAVRIGDKALFEPLPDGCHVYDLGAEWTRATNLPFVFAAWIARRGTVDRETYRILHESHRVGRRSIDLIAEDYSFAGRRDPELARRYLNEHILSRLGGPEVRAIKTFLELAARHGVIERVPEVRLAFAADSACHAAAADAGSLPA